MPENRNALCYTQDENCVKMDKKLEFINFPTVFVKVGVVILYQKLSI